MTLIDEAVVFSQTLVRAKSITPDRTLCHALISERLQQSGFSSESLCYGDIDGVGDDAMVQNLWCHKKGSGTNAPLFCFLGHTDVVPAGDENAWHHPPFSGTICDGKLWGRGAADMKSAVAAFVVATERFIDKNPNHQGDIALLITGDEEGVARFGTRCVVQTLLERGVHIDYCLVGEPSSKTHLGDTIKNGRRGSLSATISVHGKQGHVAYPDLAINPIHALMPALSDLSQTVWDNGNAHFPPTTFQISNIQSGTGAVNVIPQTATAWCNFRYSTEQNADTLMARTQDIIARHLNDTFATFSIDWHLSGEPFLTSEGALMHATTQAVQAHTGYAPKLCTGGGTSDGRFVAPTGAQVIELGVLNATIHQVDECADIADISALACIYETILEKLVR